MAAINWLNPTNGDWSVGANWSTGTVPTLADDVTISASGPYIVAISSQDVANSLTFNASQAALFENAGSLVMNGALTVNSGFVSLNEANTIGSIALAGGVLAFGNAGALGAGTVALSGGELLGTANETLSNGLTFSGTSTIAAAHGTTLNENASFQSTAANAVLNFGSVGEDGTILWHTGGAAFALPISVNVQAGTLKAADNNLSFLVNNASQTTVAAGATIDVAGFSTFISDLLGAGAVIDSGTAATLTLGAADFSGAISGPLSLVANGVVALTGANTYAGATTINSGDSLLLGFGGATGSIGGGAISDDGMLSIYRNNAITLTNAISGAGGLRQVGTGVTTINTANTFSGGTYLSAGTLAIGNGAALGTGTVAMSGGELLATANETLSNALSCSGTSTIAAAHGTTLNETGFASISGNSTLNFGGPGQDGVVSWAPGGFSITTPITVNVVAGTLKAASSWPASIISFGAQPTTVDAGATLDAGGFGLYLTSLLGAGTVTDSGATTTLSLAAANFSGTISGALSLAFNGNAALSGLEDYWGGATLNGPITVANTGAYDIVANTNIAGTPASLFVNNGLFEKTGGGGVSDVTSNFVNNGTLNVLSGSIQFSGGFSNHGLIHGLVRQSGGVTTISAPVPSDFSGDALSDVLWRGANGDALMWNSNGSGGFSGQDLGVVDNGYQVAGAADFNGDGRADILWRNVNGDVALWNSNGSGGFAGQDLGVVPTSYQIAGTGDFNGDGEADILWRNTNGDTLLWNSNGAGGFTGQDLGIVPTSYQVAGTGDFNGDGKADILWRNTNGDTVLWNSNGAGGFTGEDLGVVSTSYQVAGVADFNGDGKADILWRNANGDTVLWNSNGAGGFTGQDLGVVPTSYQVAGTGDFNGDGKADILWRNTSGDVVLWDSNGSAGFTGHDLGVVSNSFKIQPTWG
jgi:autotransporter-associated beta strand protein